MSVLIPYIFNEGKKRIPPFPGGKGACPKCGLDVVARCGMNNEWHWSHLKKDCDYWTYEPKTKWHINWQNLFNDDQTEVYIKHDKECHIADILTDDGIVIEVQHSPISNVEIYRRENFYDRLIWVIDTKEFKHNLNFKCFEININRFWFGHITPYGDNINGYAITVPDDDNGEILESLSKCNFKRAFDKEKEIEFWYNMRTTYENVLPKEITNAFYNYQLDIKFTEKLEELISFGTPFKWKSFRKSWLEAKHRFLDMNNGYLFYIKTLYESGNGFGRVIRKSSFLKKYGN